MLLVSVFLISCHTRSIPFCYSNYPTSLPHHRFLREKKVERAYTDRSGHSPKLVPRIRACQASISTFPFTQSNKKQKNVVFCAPLVAVSLFPCLIQCRFPVVHYCYSTREDVHISNYHFGLVLFFEIRHDIRYRYESVGCSAVAKAI